MALESLAITEAASYDVLFVEGWKETVTVGTLADLAGLAAPNGARVLVLSADAVYTLDTSRADTADGSRVVARTAGTGRWFLFLPDFNLLWVTQQFVDLKLYAFTPVQASVSPSSAPAITITLPDTGPADGHAHRVSCFGFAPNGDMWVGFYDTHPTAPNSGQYVAKLSASKLVVTSSQSPDFSFPVVAFGISSLGIATTLVAPNGDLWVSTIASTGTTGGLLYYPAASIAAPGSPSPTRVIAQPGINAVNDLWLDPLGNMWFCNALAGTVCRLSATQLLSSNSAIVPEVVLAVGAHTGCTLDARGNLWCAKAGGVSVFAAEDVQQSGAPTPIRVITVPSASTAAKVRLDNAGNLWAQPNGYPSFDVVRGGAPPPRATLTGAGALTIPRVVNFNPQSFT